MLSRRPQTAQVHKYKALPVYNGRRDIHQQAGSHQIGEYTLLQPIMTWHRHTCVYIRQQSCQFFYVAGRELVAGENKNKSQLQDDKKLPD